MLFLPSLLLDALTWTPVVIVAFGVHRSSNSPNDPRPPACRWPFRSHSIQGPEMGVLPMITDNHPSSAICSMHPIQQSVKTSDLRPKQFLPSGKSQSRPAGRAFLPCRWLGRKGTGGNQGPWRRGGRKRPALQQPTRES